MTKPLNQTYQTYETYGTGPHSVSLVTTLPGGVGRVHRGQRPRPETRLLHALHRNRQDITFTEGSAR